MAARQRRFKSGLVGADRHAVLLGRFEGAGLGHGHDGHGQDKSEAGTQQSGYLGGDADASKHVFLQFPQQTINTSSG